MGISLDGLASGLPTKELIASLMQIEAVPQTLLKNKATRTTSIVTVLQALNQRIAALGDLSKAAAKPTALDLHTALTSSDGATATVGSGAAAGSIDFVVDKLAQAQSGVTAAMREWSTPPALTIVGSNGTTTEIAPASSSLDDVAKAINDAGVGVRALKVASGFDGSGDPLFRLQLTGTTTGATSGFSIYQGTAADVAASTAVDVLASPGAAIITAAQDAEITLWAGTAASQTVTSATNSFEALLPGVSVTVAKADPNPVTLTVARDVEGATKVAQDLVTSLTEIFSFIDARTKVSIGTDGATTGGVFSGDSTVRSAKQSLLSAISMPINGHSPADVGINITKHGTIEFDAEKFAAALASDPAKVEAAIAGLSKRVADVATQQSDKYDGVLTAKITGQESLAKSLTEQVASWDDRLAAREATLQRTYSALEVRMSAMNAQMTWLNSQIASLPKSGGTTK
ncbi:flagellar filament capping protein FliD [Salinibacterium hongtaonis]|uniref:Flagellar hook-associated protein 2 n=1 Tax=Homoserinimonas hongtaonis TaxID=2079791 RepID=A0A2U1T1T2_9MICO|nr:flagellar filament capping protein FliD [Salinibacterium hongtaonis]AWB90394.1 hypothetical protein C2138_13265 [Salinibacterium hongtaonis]PWB97834.1 hypothetical protein DF220_08315 [Salinibacterium hongtaonis]